MKMSLKTVPHIAQKIAIELNKSSAVTMTEGLEPIVREATKVLEDSVKKEMALDQKVSEICDENEEEIEFVNADSRQLFYMIKKKLAPEFDVILDYEDRYSDISHKVLQAIYEEDLINYDIAENRIKNIIYEAITGFIVDAKDIEDSIMQKIRSYKKRYIPGTDEFEILYEKLYKEELTRKGMGS
ncbi:MAG: DUF507 family protein [Sulfurimonas sp.]|jgi:hypothetical protein|nr:DUF507 family protein [Sulfurimonadaceae bacterium]